MDNFYVWTIVILLTIGTFSIRSSFIFLSHKISIEDRTKEIFSFIPAAILPALLTPLVYFHQGEVELLLNKERIVVLLAATLVCYLTKSMVATIAFGLSLLYVLTQFLS